MSLQQLAQTVQAQGRGNDTTLVHMTPGEVAGLQQLAQANGGSLTVNPQTGLPEAGFLEDILPVIAAAAAIYFTGGLGLGAMGAAGGAGAGAAGAAGAGAAAAGTSAATAGALTAGSAAGTGLGLTAAGSGLGLTATGTGLGLTAGAAGAAGAGTAAGLGTLGAAGAAGAGLSAADLVALEAVSNAGTLSSGVSAAELAAAEAASMEGMYGVTGMYDAATAAGTGMSAADLTALEAVSNPGMLSSGVQASELATSGVNAASAPSWGEQLMQNVADSSWKERMQMVSQAQRLMPQDQQRPAQYPGAPGLISPRAASVDLPSSGQAPAPGRPSSGGKGIVPGETREAALRRAAQQQVAFGQRGFGTYPSARFAEGGLTSLESGGFVVPADVVSAMGSGSTNAGLRALAPLGAEPIRGPGDGQSDDIPTTVDGRKPARVADGEAYLSPRAVAKLGGGDSAAGAKKLYAMMDRVRQQAHGHTKQQRPVNLKKAMA